MSSAHPSLVYQFGAAVLRFRPAAREVLEALGSVCKDEQTGMERVEAQQRESLFFHEDLF